jgi:hypothetical protein
MWMKGFLFLITLTLALSQREKEYMQKEARMNINRNFWKQGPLLAGLPFVSM